MKNKSTSAIINLCMAGYIMGLMNEYIAKRLSARDLEDELNSLIKRYNKIGNTFLVIYAGAIGKPIPDVSICMDDYYILFDLLRGKEVATVDFYIETPGGSGEAAEEIVRFLRNKFDHITFIVSGEAKSAGTLIVLSGNEIMLTESGSLGPIDAQVKIGRAIVSAHDYKEWVEKKQEEAEKNNKLNPFDATMIAQISPGELSGVFHSLQFAQDLVVDWLSKYKFKNWNVTETRKQKVTDDMKIERAREIAKDLCNHSKWRSHGRSIKRYDLENIGLKIIRADDDPKVADIIYRIQTVIRLLFATTSIYKVFAIEDLRLKKQAVQVESGPRLPVKQNPEVAEFTIKCPQCGKIHKMYAKLIDDPAIDEAFKKAGKKQLKSDKLECECGFEIDLTGLRNEIETVTRKKIIVEGDNNDEKGV